MCTDAQLKGPFYEQNLWNLVILFEHRELPSSFPTVLQLQDNVTIQHVVRMYE